MTSLTTDARSIMPVKQRQIDEIKMYPTGTWKIGNSSFAKRHSVYSPSPFKKYTLPQSSSISYYKKRSPSPRSARHPAPSNYYLFILTFLLSIIPEYTKFKCSILFSRLRRRQVLGGAFRAERGWTWSDPYNENWVWRAYIDDGKTTSSVTTVISKTILVSTSVSRGSSSICRSSWWSHDVCDENEPQIWWFKE